MSCLGEAQAAVATVIGLNRLRNSLRGVPDACYRMLDDEPVFRLVNLQLFGHAGCPLGQGQMQDAVDVGGVCFTLLDFKW